LKDGAVTFPLSRLWLALPLILAAFLVPVSRAEAGPIVSSATNCDDEALEQPFAAWGDPAQYFLVPNGSFSGGADGWRLSKADVVAENRPNSSHAETAAALRLPAGASATSPAVCVGIEHPTVRFFTKSDAPLYTLRVDVLFEDSLGLVHALPIGVVPATGKWEPTLPTPVVANLLALLPGERTAVSFRFTAQGLGGAFLIDDVYVDPYGRG
jgi:hypothetical protein